MCCDICPYFEECQELDKLQENCCAECPDYADCMGGEEYQEEFNDEDSEEY